VALKGLISVLIRDMELILEQVVTGSHDNSGPPIIELDSNDDFDRLCLLL
jgi:hypothetical protein